MNILMVSDIFMPSFADRAGELTLSGAERVLIEESRALSGMGNKVYLLSRRMEENGDSRYDYDDISVLTFYAKPSLKLSFAGNSLRGPRKLISEIEEEIDIINFHQPFSAFAINCLPQRNKIPSVYTCHSLGHEEYATRCAVEKGSLTFADYSLVIPVMKYLEKYNFKKSDYIRVLSNYTSKRLRKFYPVAPSKIKVIPGGVDENKFVVSDNVEALRKKFDLPPDRLIISTLRNMEPRMGIENLIEAAVKIREYSDSVTFVIGGNGPLKAKLENMVVTEKLSSFVKFTGYISEEDLHGFYSMSDFFVLPTVEQEGFGLVTVESLACGTPVLGTSVGATPEILSNVEEQLIIPSPSPDSLAEAIKKWICIYKNEREFYDKTAIKGRNVVEERYTWKKSAENLMALYESML